MNKIDLHLHTDQSDGRISPLELLTLCRDRGFKNISITDHDTLNGYLQAKKYAKDYGIELIPGVEISSFFLGKEVHILVYYFEENNQMLNQLLEMINSSRISRARKIINNLISAGIGLNFDKIYAKTGKSGIIGRVHLAREINALKPELTIKDIFNRYLNEKTSYFVPKKTCPLEKVLPIVKNSGGISVLAHPHRLKNKQMISDLLIAGIDGIEIYCPTSAEHTRNFLLRQAYKHGLLITGGSDFHCEPYEKPAFGSFSVPEICLTNLRNYKNHYLRNDSLKGVKIETKHRPYRY